MSTLSVKSNAGLFNASIVLILIAALLTPFLIYFGTAQSIVAIWNSSETFAHGYIILPISLWLIWKRRQVLSTLSPAPYWPGLLLIAACGFGWLLADLGDVQVVRQYTFVAMLPAIVISMLGLRISWKMAFPLFFLLLAVPFGDVFIEPLINFTADFTVAALQATGIPVLRNGASFEIPSGSWSVVEACSGVRYLISSITLGFLYAYLTYVSRIRQLMFVLLSIIVPIIANGMRAYMIVMIGHLSGMQLAVGVDHLIYGWLFFGLVMFLMFWIGSFWHENKKDVLPVTTANQESEQVKAVPVSRLFIALIGVVISLGIWPLYGNYLARTRFNPATPILNSFHPDWQPTTAFTDWKPYFAPAKTELYQFFSQDKQALGISVLYYRNQSRGAGLISSSNKLVPEKDPVWFNVGSSVRQETIGKQSLSLRESRLQSAAGPLLVWHWYWVGGQFTSNDYLGKVLQTKEEILMRGDDGAALAVFAPYTANPDEARVVMRHFLDSNMTTLEKTLAANKKQ
ncbi:exosortase A [Undibacterium sp. GrIS 1.2]|uniref:exosortase A n=1 Tax=Undibacterium sp. GrIS 1.2 TaxID=3143933 RepID=UPI00339B9B98